MTMLKYMTIIDKHLVKLANDIGRDKVREMFDK